MDLFTAIPKMRFPSSNEEKCKLATEFLKVKVPQFCKLADEILSKNGGHYFVGNSVFWKRWTLSSCSFKVETFSNLANLGRHCCRTFFRPCGLYSRYSFCWSSRRWRPFQNIGKVPSPQKTSWNGFESKWNQRMDKKSPKYSILSMIHWYKVQYS